MTKAYTLEVGEYSDYKVLGVFSTHENAERVSKSLSISYDNPRIVKREIDPGVAELMVGYSPFYVRMQWDGSEADAIKGDESECCIHTGNDYLIMGYVWAKDKQHAIKIVNEKRVQELALHPKRIHQGR